MRATDAAGNLDETPATQVFGAKVDTIPPDGQITDGPADGAVLNQSSVTYSFQVSDIRSIQNTWCVVYDNATGFPYRLPTDDPNGLASGEKLCNSPVTFENIPDGNYTFSLYPQDRSGKTDPSPASRTFTVDTTPPQITVTGPEGTTSETPATYTLSSNEPVTWECTFTHTFPGESTPNETGSDPCATGTKTWGINKDGTYVFTFKAADAAGNTSTVTKTLILDRTVPT